MKYCLITFRSVTPAQRGERILNRAGITCTLSRTPKWMEKQGCGYSLRIQTHTAARSAEVLREENVEFQKIYLLRENGKGEELHL